MSAGFYKRRRGILEHIDSGEIDLLESGLHDYLLLKANLLIESPAAKPTPPADARFQPFYQFASESYTSKHGQRPIWVGNDRNGLKSLLKNQRAENLPLERLKTNWRNFLASTEPFTVKQGDSLAYFCSNIDKFSDGPVMATPRKGTNGKPTATDLALRNARALGLNGPAN